MRASIGLMTIALAFGAALPAVAEGPEKPTIVLVHGAFAESSSWNAVITALEHDGYPVIAAANPLRSVHGDAVAVGSVVRSVQGPVVLVGHSYGGPVITEAADGNANVRALVYVAAFAPDIGESVSSLSVKYPGSTLSDTIVPVKRADGIIDLYIEPSKFHAQFAADVPAADAALMAAAQRPVTQAALEEPARTATWKTLPSYVIYGSADRNVPPAVIKFMAERALARRTVVVTGGSHALMVSRPREVVQVIEAAARGE